MARPDRLLRTALLLGTALASMPAAALPGAPGTIATNTGGGAPVLTTPVAGTLDVKLNAARTVLQYTNFGIATGETVNFRFDNRSDLAVVHATDSAITVDGTLNSFVGAAYGGNVWLLSAAGVFFGAGAHVDVGGLLASTSIPSNLLDPAGPVLSPSVLSFDFGNGNGVVSIAGGAQITGHGGTLAFIATSVTTGRGAVIGGAGDTAVLYGAAQRYTVRFMQEAGNDLDLLDFEVPGLTAGTAAAMPLALAGTTAAGNVYIAAVNRADAVRAVLDAQGDIGATSAGVEGGSVVLTAGGGIANRAAAPLFGDGTYRQDIRAGMINASRAVSATATGDIDLLGAVTAGGSIVLRGLNVAATELTAGQDIIVRTGDAAGSSGAGTPGYGGYGGGYGGYGYGYGGYGGTPAYGPEAGNFYTDLVSAGDDIAVDTFGGSIDIGRIVLAGVGPDAAGDPLGTLDAAGDGRRLALRTYGTDADSIYLGRHGSYSGISGGTSLVIDSARDAFVFETGDVTLTSVTTHGTLDIHADGALTVAALSGVGALTASSGGALDIGSATTTIDLYGNGQIALEGGTSARLGTGNAATDIIIVSDNGDATITNATAGDDLIVRAFGGNVSVGSAFVGFGGEAPDVDGNQISFGEGSGTIFPDLALDTFGNGRVIDLAASRTPRVVSGGEGGGQFFAAAAIEPGAGTGGSISFGLGTGQTSGATLVTLAAESDIVVDLNSDAVVDQLDAGGSASITSRTGDALVGSASTRFDLSVIAANGLAQIGDAHVGQDLLLSGAQVSLGSLGPYSEGGYGGYGYGGNGYGATLYPTRDVTIIATAGDFLLPLHGSFAAGRDLTINVSGELDAGDLTAGRNLSLTGGDVFVDGTASAGEDASVTASTGDLFVNALVAGDDATITGSPLGLLDVNSVTTSGAGVDAEGDGANIRISGSSISVAEIAAAGNLNIDATDTATFGFGSAGATAVGNITVRAAAIDFDHVAAGGDLSLTAFDGGIAPYALGGSGSATSGRDVTIVTDDVLTGVTLSAVRDLLLTGTGVDVGETNAGRDLTVTATAGDIRLGRATAGDDIRLSAASFTGPSGLQGGGIDVGTALANGGGGDSEGDGANIVGNGRIITLAQASAMTDIRLTGAGLVTLGVTAPGSEEAGYALAGNDIVVSGGSLSTGPLDAGRDLSLTATASGIDAGSLTAVRDLTLDAVQTLTFDTAGAGRDLRLTGNAVGGGTATAGRDLYGNAVTTLALVNATAGDDIRLAAATIDVDAVRSTGLGEDSEGDDANIVATGGDVTLEQASAPHDIIVSGTGAVIIGSASAGAQAGAVGAYFAQAGNDIMLTGGSLLTGPLDAGHDIVLTAGTGGLDARAAMTAGNDLNADVSGLARFAASIGAGRDIVIGAGDVAAVDLDAERDIRVQAGSIVIDTAAARNDIILTASTGDARLRSADVKRDLTLVALQGLAQVGDARVGRDLSMTGGRVMLGSLDGYSESGGYGYGYGQGAVFTLTRDAVLDAVTTDASVGTDLVVARDINVRAARDATLGNLDAGNDVIGVAGGALVLGDATAGRDIILSGGTLGVGSLDAGRDIALTATAGSFTAAALTAVRDLSVDAVGITLGTAGAGRDLTLDAGTGTLTLTSGTAGDDVRLSGATQALGQVNATGLGEDSEGDGSNVVLSGSQITATQLVAATDISVTGTGAVSIGQATATRDVTVSGGSVGGALQLSGRDVSVSTGGAFAASAGLVAARDLHLTAGTTLSFAQLTAARDLFLTAATVSGGSAVATRDLTVNATTAITGTLYQAGRNLVLDPNEAINVATARATGDATLIGASVVVGTLDVGGTTNVQATAGGVTIDTFTGHAATLLATGKVDLGDASGSDVRIVGGDLDVRRSLVAATLAVETPGRMVLGGTAAPGETGFRLAAADIARLRVSGIANFYAGVTTAANAGAQTPGGDLILQDFGYDPANLPRLAFFADRSHVIDVQGLVLPTTSGGAIQFGDANINGRFRPDSVYVSGGIGTAELVVNCFGRIVAVASLSIFAVNDVIFGTGDFRTAVKGTLAADIDIAAGSPSVTGPGDNRLFAVTTQLNVGAGGKIVSQNTASNLGEYVGLFVVGTGASAPIVNVGNARAIDLSGSIVDATGSLRSGPLVARAAELGPGGVNGALFRFNGCVVGSGDCGGSNQNGDTPAEALRVEDYQPPRPIDITDSPLTTVLVIDQQGTNLDVLTIGTDANAIVIKKRPGGN